MEAHRRTLPPRHPAPGSHRECEKGEFPVSMWRTKKPARHHCDQDCIIQPSAEESWSCGVIIRMRPTGEPRTRDADAFHKKPPRVVEKFCPGGEPASQ